MLCTKIIIGDFMDLSCDVSVAFGGLEKELVLNLKEGYASIREDADDAQIFNICRVVSDVIYDSIIKKELKAFLYASYGCFTKDEYERILKRVWDRPFAKELPGRLYVYLKVHGRVNPVGFYRFMCKDLADTARIASTEEADRIIDMNDRNEMIETLKCFAGLSGESVSKVVLWAHRGKIEIKECIPLGLSSAEFWEDDVDILAELVTLNPGVIEIHGREEFIQNEISTVIEAVFEDRIQYR